MSKTRAALRPTGIGEYMTTDDEYVVWFDAITRDWNVAIAITAAVYPRPDCSGRPQRELVGTAWESSHDTFGEALAEVTSRCDRDEDGPDPDDRYR